MPKISIIMFILELYTQIGIINNSLVLPSVIEMLGTNLPQADPYLIKTATATQLQHAYASVANILISENTINILKNLLLISSLLSLVIGTVVGLAQSKIKRLLACQLI